MSPLPASSFIGCFTTSIHREGPAVESPNRNSYENALVTHSGLRSFAHPECPEARPRLPFLTGRRGERLRSGGRRSASGGQSLQLQHLSHVGRALPHPGRL